MAKSIKKGNPFMKKETKNIITREFIEKELRFFNTTETRSTIGLCGSLSLFLLPLTLVAIYVICYIIENIWLRLLLSALAAMFMNAALLVNAWKLRDLMKDKKALERGEFDVVTRKVITKSEKKTYGSTDEFLHFNDLKEVAVGHTVFQLASEGDEFYLVHYRKQDSIKLVYPSKMYEYKER
jgi:hypothetical protein